MFRASTVLLTLLCLACAPAVSTADGWHIQPVETVGSTGEYTSIVLDSNDHPHIAYYNNTQGGLKYARWDGMSWQIESGSSPVPGGESITR